MADSIYLRRQQGLRSYCRRLKFKRQNKSQMMEDLKRLFVDIEFRAEEKLKLFPPHEKYLRSIHQRDGLSCHDDKEEKVGTKVPMDVPSNRWRWWWCESHGT